MTMKLSYGRLLGWLAGIASAAAIATSIWLHPPSEMRARRLDELRMQSLNQTEMAVRFYYASHHTLPAELSALETGENHHQEVKWHDPESNRPFEYAVTGETTYQLCATFARKSDHSDLSNGLNEAHNSGRDCFQKMVAPDGR